ncbi:DUF7147 family protein [Jeotgalibacillus proteolyticus]|uniref:Methylthioribose kinase n=1 Tax=Jeotgalibacillus proteolyticus TaxID=2082395 RepID=A0A2S5GGJ8_9BACL|nr:methylthioribose kinase [Jeotgalibacillus proteolyticus]PPA72160.1 methylthioribose kinase [Jeotgalibacillus proteolyticus]
MIQRFIEIGEGFSDLYEMLELIKANKDRAERLLALHTKDGDKNNTSVAVVMKKTDPGNFQAIYICREGIPDPRVTPNKRFELFVKAAEEHSLPLIELDVQPSGRFAEKDLYFQYLTGILRMNRYLSPLT